jgi:type III pantothenate kinase
MSRILTVDIGNSNIVIGSWNDDKLERTWRIQTRRDYSADELVMELSFLQGLPYDGAILASVVPEITDKTSDALEKIIGKRPLLMGPFLRTGVDISGYKAGAIGMDRIVDMAAAVSIFGAPVLVCDLGTCTTITVAEECGEGTGCDSLGELSGAFGKITGGMICPGVQLSLDAEAVRTSQLPQLKAVEAESVLGNDTASNMICGAVAGTGMMITELARRLRSGMMTPDGAVAKATSKEMNKLKIVVTGGLGKLVLPWIKSGTAADIEIHYDEDLLLRGLREIFILNQ